jgi:hypothetical protein
MVLPRRCWRLRALRALPGLLPAAACEPEPEPVDVATRDACEWTGGQHCMLPWPSDRWLRADSSTATGFRLDYDPLSIPSNKDGDLLDVEPYARIDGFSPSSHLLTMFELPVDTDGLATLGHWDESLAPDSPTRIVDLESGEFIPHFVEVDARAREENPESPVDPPTLLYLRPALRLREGAWYGVALRGIRLADGSEPVPNAAFAALRDGVPTTNETLEAARPGWDALFAGLEAAGVARADLVQAWGFHTASGASIRADIMAARADALQRIGEGPAAGDCVVESVAQDPYPEVKWRVQGTFSAPLYMEEDEAGTVAHRGAGGLPAWNGEALAPFTVQIPHALAGADAPAGPLTQFGHGLLGQAEDEMEGTFVREFGATYGRVMLGTDWQGMSRPDLGTVGAALAELSGLARVADRAAQGMVNQMALTRAFMGACRDLPELAPDGHPVIDADAEPTFIGISQGSILGGTFLTISPDIPRGALLVGGMNFPFLITRSDAFPGYELILAAWYEDRVDREILLHLTISMWDRFHPDPWYPHLANDSEAGIGGKGVLYQVADDDTTVTTLGAEMAVRTMGIPLLAPALRPVWGVAEAQGPLPSAAIWYDLGRAAPPETNVPPAEDNEVHNDQRNIAAAREQIDTFLRTGEVVQTCEGTCDPE